ncbi:ABC transporter ATP-binding protein [Paenibacillus sp. 481]|uniref:ABC transporter ATP-binding protein n=1 Tax=Paenibacillus sp. 481 TaxID=2835869 RepID=UPI001E555DAE|nr:ABC transporter ATP-binding protein [Paenibacillus sp. 481]UHA74555.1 ABC transporter ATP-binding protein [Paenibacillus sp. 481]
MSYVSIQQLTKSFSKQTVLHNLQLQCEHGELITLLGPSGCGKSTLLRIIAGLTTPDSGTIHIAGQDVTSLPAKDREIGMVFQSYALFPNLTVAENIAFGLQMKKLPPAAIKQEVADMIQLVGLEDKERAYPRELSGGQQQRVALARSLVLKPKVLLLDEPLSALDAQIRKHLRKQLRDIQRELNMTTVLVTHDQEEAMSISDRIYLMNAGKMEQFGSPHDIYTRPRSSFVARFIGNYNVLSRAELERLAPHCAAQAEQALRYAIRPETLSEEPIPYGDALTGTIDHVSMLGNITRFEMDIAGCRVYADHLHRAYEPSCSGQLKTIYLNPKDVIPLHDDAA